MKGKRERRKRFNEIDLALRATCPHPYARQHEPRILVDWQPVSQKANSVWRGDSQCVLCLQPIVAFNGPTGTPVWRSQRYLIEEVPW